ncbi:hypothetical protein HYH03_013367 [Edaphochlamys debaryana]|uniref:Protein kinase domain-containing protein n=1 Tax=Edaphochlamys debaryana TaxID=47281 RepID=A0A836BUL8_9CHLO|nr:hypothetical protein HYH03_013367 [Edaphochlamys debaryana]|eukprot:KAG2488064.1 hypothetical protein HYH03_013367 [Edaphochlamys debaryana]
MVPVPILLDSGEFSPRGERQQRHDGLRLTALGLRGVEPPGFRAGSADKPYAPGTGGGHGEKADTLEGASALHSGDTPTSPGPTHHHHLLRAFTSSTLVTGDAHAKVLSPTGPSLEKQIAARRQLDWGVLDTWPRPDSSGDAYASTPAAPKQAPAAPPVIPAAAVAATSSPHMRLIALPPGRLSGCGLPPSSTMPSRAAAPTQAAAAADKPAAAPEGKPKGGLARFLQKVTTHPLSRMLSSSAEERQRSQPKAPKPKSAEPTPACPDVSLSPIASPRAREAPLDPSPTAASAPPTDDTEEAVPSGVTPTPAPSFSSPTPAAKANAPRPGAPVWPLSAASEDRWLDAATPFSASPGADQQPPAARPAAPSAGLRVHNLARSLTAAPAPTSPPASPATPTSPTTSAAASAAASAPAGPAGAAADAAAAAAAAAASSTADASTTGASDSESTCGGGSCYDTFTSKSGSSRLMSTFGSGLSALALPSPGAAVRCGGRDGTRGGGNDAGSALTSPAPTPTKASSDPATTPTKAPATTMPPSAITPVPVPVPPSPSKPPPTPSTAPPAALASPTGTVAAAVAAAPPQPAVFRTTSLRSFSPPPFVALARPALDGPISVWQGAPTAMRRLEWSSEDFHIARCLYKGYASEVFKATCLKSVKDVVLKAYTLSSLSPFLTHQALREVSIHSRLEHPSIVQFMAAFKEDDFLVLVMEYAAGGSLDRARRKLGGRLSEAQAAQVVMLPLLRALAYLHRQGVVHRDIKPENLLFTPDWQLKLCDMGVSVCLREERAVTRTGSKDYMAPEVTPCPLKRSPADNKDDEAIAYSSAVDVWSVGVVAYELLTGFTPFPGGPPSLRSSSPASRLAYPSSVSGAARDFVTACLAMQPQDRPTVPELLRHPWMEAALAQLSPRG